MRASELEKIVQAYGKCHAARAQRELDEFREEVSDEAAVSRAALAQLPDGKRHRHQYRITRVVLSESQQRLLANLVSLRQSASFDDLFERVEMISGSIHGIGELAVYDTALRIGARLGLEPTKVYLHAGTRKGARALGFDARRRTIEMDELPRALRGLTAREVEDLLCIYKDGFDGSPSSCGVKTEPRRGC